MVILFPYTICVTPELFIVTSPFPVVGLIDIPVPYIILSTPFKDVTQVLVEVSKL